MMEAAMSLSMRFTGAVIICVLVASLCGAQSGDVKKVDGKQTTAEIMRSFTTIYVHSKTWLAKPEFVAGQLQKEKEFDRWGLAITNDPNADVIVEVDHQPGWFYYTYSMTHQASGIVLATGRVTAADGKLASTQIGKNLIKRIAQFRNVPDKKSE